LEVVDIAIKGLVVGFITVFVAYFLTLTKFTLLGATVQKVMSYKISIYVLHIILIKLMMEETQLRNWSVFITEEVESKNHFKEPEIEL
jgi:hypothetical protein